MRVLLIDGCVRHQRCVGDALRGDGYLVDVTSDGDVGLWMTHGNSYDVILLDPVLPKLDGLNLLRRLREHGNDAFVIITTAKGAVEDRVRGLESGSDDYLVKPFALIELQARIRALLRRKQGLLSLQVRVGTLQIDLANRSVRRAGKLVELRPREFAVLKYLASHSGKLIQRAELETHLFGDRFAPSSNVVDAAIYALRKQIDEPGTESLIQTRRGLGYTFEYQKVD